MADDLAVSLGTQETAWLEFKNYTNPGNRGEDLGRAVCAMANDLTRHGSGHIIVGVDKNGLPVDGVDTSDRALLTLADLRDTGKILDRPSLTVAVGVYRGKPVVHLRVEASAAPPVRYDGRVWVRPGPTTRQATRDDERVLAERRRAGDTTFDYSPAHGSTIADLDLDLFRATYLPAMVDPDIIAENDRPLELQLASLHLMRDGEEPTPTVLGILVLGYDPSRRIPGAYVQFVRYEGVDVDAPIADEQEVRGNVVDVATRMEALIKGHLRTRITGEGFREESAPEYPLAALRELLMNALMHRNYETSNAPTRITWFDDRIEVMNPGGPFGQVRADNFDRANDYRNPSLAAAMKALGYVNRFGRGIGRVRAALARNGNPDPVFRIDTSTWSVTVRQAL